MFRDPADPRLQTLPPTPEEVEAWARREHERRQAWLTGPSEDEVREWARRYRRRARFGLEESRLGPSREEIERWSQRERSRRDAWAAGPSESEKQEWARQQTLRSSAAQPVAPTLEEASAWAEREAQRRREWLSGPSEEEKQDWARRQASGGWADWISPDVFESGLPELATRALREAELAGKGSIYALSRAPAAIWSYFVRAGRSLEDQYYRQPGRRRVPF
jgi:hypothetical protein